MATQINTKKNVNISTKKANLPENLKAFTDAGVEMKLTQRDILEIISEQLYNDILAEIEEGKKAADLFNLVPGLKEFKEKEKKSFIKEIKKEIEDLDPSKVTVCFVTNVVRPSHVCLLLDNTYGTTNFNERFLDISLSFSYREDSTEEVRGIKIQRTFAFSKKVDFTGISKEELLELLKERKEKANELYLKIQELTGSSKLTKQTILTEARLRFNKMLISTGENTLKDLLKTKFNVKFD